MPLRYGREPIDERHELTCKSCFPSYERSRAGTRSGLVLHERRVRQRREPRVDRVHLLEERRFVLRQHGRVREEGRQRFVDRGIEDEKAVACGRFRVPAERYSGTRREPGAGEDQF